MSEEAYDVQHNDYKIIVVKPNNSLIITNYYAWDKPKKFLYDKKLEYLSYFGYNIDICYIGDKSYDGSTEVKQKINNIARTLLFFDRKLTYENGPYG